MGWDSSTKKLTYPFTKIAANGQGDLQKALNRTSTRHYDLIVNGDVKMFAKYKPVNVNKTSGITEADRVQAHQGFTYNDTQNDRKSYYHSSLTAAFETAKAMRDSNGIVQWEYLRTGFYWYRALDFVPYDPNAQNHYAGNGYYGNAVSPFALIARGQEPNSPANTWWFSFTFIYVPSSLVVALSDLKVYADNPSNWYWGVVYQLAGTTAFSWLYTEPGGSTKMPVTAGTIQDYNQGFIAVSAVAGATSLEAYLVAARKSGANDSAVGYIHLPLHEASCTITTPSNTISAITTVYQDPRQVAAGLTRMPGFYVTSITSSGTLAVIATAARIQLYGLQAYMATQSSNVSASVKVKLTGATQTREGSTSYTIVKNNTPENAYVDVNPFGSSSNPIDVPSNIIGNIKVVIQLTVGGLSWWVNPATGAPYNTESQATVKFSDIYAKNNASLLWIEYYDSTNQTYDPSPYPPSV